MDTDKIRIYEASFHLTSKSEDEAKDEFNKLVSHLESKKAKVIAKEEVMHTQLQYEIKSSVRNEEGAYQRYTETYFGSIKFEADPQTAKEFEDYLKEDKNILRSIVFKTISENTRVGDIFPKEEEKEKLPARTNQTESNSDVSLSGEGVDYE